MDPGCRSATVGRWRRRFGGRRTNWACAQWLGWKVWVIRTEGVGLASGRTSWPSPEPRHCPMYLIAPQTPTTPAACPNSVFPPYHWAPSSTKNKWPPDAPSPRRFASQCSPEHFQPHFFGACIDPPLDLTAFRRPRADGAVAQPTRRPKSPLLPLHNHGPWSCTVAVRHCRIIAASSCPFIDRRCGRPDLPPVSQAHTLCG